MFIILKTILRLKMSKKANMSKKETKETKVKVAPYYCFALNGGIIKTGYCLIGHGFTHPESELEKYKLYYGNDLKGYYIKTKISPDIIGKKFTEKFKKTQITDIITKTFITETKKIIKEIAEGSKFTTMNVFAKKEGDTEDAEDGDDADDADDAEESEAEEEEEIVVKTKKSTKENKKVEKAEKKTEKKADKKAEKKTDKKTEKKSKAKVKEESDSESDNNAINNKTEIILSDDSDSDSDIEVEEA